MKVRAGYSGLAEPIEVMDFLYYLYKKDKTAMAWPDKQHKTVFQLFTSAVLVCGIGRCDTHFKLHYN